MKYLLLILLAVPLCLNAQWERVGYAGGMKLTSLVNYHNYLYGISLYDIYRSSDDGQTWEIFNDGIPRSIFISPDNLYIYNDTLILQLSGDPSAINGLLKSRSIIYSHHNSQWEIVPKLSHTQYQIYQISKDSLLYLHPVNTGLPDYFQFSTDGGISWEGRDRFFPDSISNIKQSFFRSNIISVECYYDTLVYDQHNGFINARYYRQYISTDFGLSWKRLFSDLPPSHSATVYITDIGLLFYAPFFINDTSTAFFRSSDNGVTWTKTLIPDLTPFSEFYGNEIYRFDSLLVATVLNRNSGLSHRIFYSLDSGKSWTTNSTLTFSKIIQSIVRKEKNRNGYILDILGNEKNIVLDNQLLNRSELIPKGLSSGISTVLYFDNGTFINTNESKDSLYISSNNGESWLSVPNSNPVLRASLWNKGTHYNFHYYSKNYSIYRSRNNGEYAEKINLPLDSSDTKPRFIFANYGDTIAVCYLYPSIYTGQVWLSTDAGNSWQQIRDSSSVSQPFNAGHIIVSHTGITLFTKDCKYYVQSQGFSNNWTAYSSPLQEIPYVTYPTYIDDKFYFYGYITNSEDSSYPFIAYNISGTNEWTNVSSELPAHFIPSDIQRYGNYLFALSYSLLPENHFDGSTRVYVSTNDGLSWKQIADSLRIDLPYLFIDKHYITVAGKQMNMYRYPMSKIVSKTRDTNKYNSITVFPNPANDHITINTDLTSEYTVTIYDVCGRMVRSSADKNPVDTIEIDVSNLVPGTYLLTLTSDQSSQILPFTVIR